MPKHTLRREMLARRRAFAPADRDAASIIIQRTLVDSPAFEAARVVALYAPIHNEVATEEIFLAALSRGKEVLFPVVSGDHLLFRCAAGHGEICPGAFGIPEPMAACPLRDPAEADIIVVPAVAFDLAGQRLGYGKGYYDRTLHAMEGSGRLVGIIYDFQLVEAIAGEPHDVRVDVIITEKRVHSPRDLDTNGRIRR
jgi:5-formyltetrahydrofolate cyclo-ligase